MKYDTAKNNPKHNKTMCIFSGTHLCSVTTIMIALGLI